MQAMSSAVLSSAFDHLSESRTRITGPALANRPFGRSSTLGSAQPSSSPMDVAIGSLYYAGSYFAPKATKKTAKSTKLDVFLILFFLANRDENHPNEQNFMFIVNTDETVTGFTLTNIQLRNTLRMYPCPF